MPIGLVLGGGAPNLPLMSGALLALDYAGLKFEVISTTGAGMLAGLLYASPRLGKEETSLREARRRALLDTKDMGIDDRIYQLLPINYKVFQKPGPLAEFMAPVFNAFFLKPLQDETDQQRLMRDWYGLLTATFLIPSNLNFKSKGLCQAPSWIEGLVDFEGLADNLEETSFRLGAYSIADNKDVTFNRENITIDHCKAALAMPFIYEPYKLADPETGEDKTYLEGSAFAPLSFNPDNVMVERDIDTIVFFDILGHRQLIDEPRDLIDAWVQSIIAPLTRLAENNLSAFKERRAQHVQEMFAAKLDEAADRIGSDPQEFIDTRDLLRKEKAFYELVDLLGSADVDRDAFAEAAKEYQKTRKDPDLAKLVKLARENYSEFVKQRETFLKRREPMTLAPEIELETQSCRPELLRMPFRRNLTEDDWSTALDWSHSNMNKLFKIGFKTGKEFAINHRTRLESSMGGKLTIEDIPDLD